MQLIPTTATAVEKIKSSAKAIKKAEKLPHMEALERAAKASGYDSWYHVGYCLDHQDTGAIAVGMSVGKTLVADLKRYMAYLADNGYATIPAPQTDRVKSNVFSDVLVDNMRFQGFLESNGPSITNVSAITQEGETFVQLGCAEIHHCCPRQGGHAAWWICKYGRDEPRINIDSLSEKGRHGLAFEFGIPIYPPSEAGSKEEEKIRLQLSDKMRFVFYLSPSFKKLRMWALSHTSHARKVRSPSVRETFLQGWKDATLNGVSPTASRVVTELLEEIALDNGSSDQ